MNDEVPLFVTRESLIHPDAAKRFACRLLAMNSQIDSFDVALFFGQVDAEEAEAGERWKRKERQNRAWFAMLPPHAREAIRLKVASLKPYPLGYRKSDEHSNTPSSNDGDRSGEGYQGDVPQDG